MALPSLDVHRFPQPPRLLDPDAARAKRIRRQRIAQLARSAQLWLRTFDALYVARTGLSINALTEAERMQLVAEAQGRSPRTMIDLIEAMADDGHDADSTADDERDA